MASPPTRFKESTVLAARMPERGLDSAAAMARVQGFDNTSNPLSQRPECPQHGGKLPTGTVSNQRAILSAKRLAPRVAQNDVSRFTSTFHGILMPLVQLGSERQITPL